MEQPKRLQEFDLHQTEELLAILHGPLLLYAPFLAVCARWLPLMAIRLVVDGGFASTDLAWTALKLNISSISRLRLDTRIFDFHLKREADLAGRSI